MKESVELDILIIGGGILGLSVAKELKKNHPQLDLAILEKERFLGDHTSGRNSGVIHAGLYYPHQSQKHIHCLNGNRLWESWCKELDIPFKRTGKFIVSPLKKDQATENSDSLETLFSKANKNNVPHLRYASEIELKDLNLYLEAGSAFFSPTTGVLDVSTAIQKLEFFLEAQQVYILKNNKALKIHPEKTVYSVETENEFIQSKVLINCAGLNGIELRKDLGLNDLKNYLVKGHYLQCSNQQLKNVKHLIYPVPNKSLKGLGVHLTLDFAGKVKFGPDTLEVSEIDYSIDDELIQHMFPQIQSLFKNVKSEELSLDYAGIRPKILKQNPKTQDFEIYSDFWIKSYPQNNQTMYIELLGIESPGLTASPSISQWVNAEIDSFFN